MIYLKTYENFQAGDYFYVIMYDKKYALTTWIDPDLFELTKDNYSNIINLYSYETEEKAATALHQISTDINYGNISIRDPYNEKDEEHGWLNRDSLEIVRFFVGAQMVGKEDDPLI